MPEQEKCPTVEIKMGLRSAVVLQICFAIATFIGSYATIKADIRAGRKDVDKALEESAKQQQVTIHILEKLSAVETSLDFIKTELRQRGGDDDSGYSRSGYRARHQDRDQDRDQK